MVFSELQSPRYNFPMAQIMSPKTQELLLFVLPLILSPLSVTAQSPSISTSSAAALIVVTTAALLLLAAFVAYYIRRYGNGCLGAATDLRQDQLVAAASAAAAAKGLGAEAVASLPSIRFAEIKRRKLDQVELECAVCLIEFEDEEILRLLPDCCHVFHSDCIKPWLASHVTCPVCRSNLEKLSGASKSAALDRISRGSSKPSDDHQTVEVDASPIMNATNGISTRGGVRLPRPHSTGELVLQVVEDNTMPKEAALTGESLPVTKNQGSVVYSGSTCKQGEIGNFCISSIAVGIVIEIIVIYGVQRRSYRTGIDNLLVLLIGGISIAMPTVLSVTMAIGAHRLAQQGAITKRTAIEEMAGMDMLCSDKTGTLTLNKLTVDRSLIEVKKLT